MRTTIQSRAMWLLAVAALVAVLALSACGGRARQPGGAPVGAGTGQQTSPTAQNVDLQAIQNADQQVQDAVNALNTASNDANQDFSTQSTETVP